MINLSYCVYLVLLERLKRKRALNLAAVKRYRVGHREEHRAYSKKWAEENPERKKAYGKKWRLENSEKLKANEQKRYAENPEKLQAFARKHRQSGDRNVRRRARRLADPNFKLRENLSRRIRQALHKTAKAARTLELIGCEISQLRTHIENQFQPGMTWENYGFRGWHIDHIKPCVKFDLTDPTQQRECFHFSNLQPLWAADNLFKKAKYGDARR